MTGPVSAWLRVDAPSPDVLAGALSLVLEPGWFDDLQVNHVAPPPPMPPPGWRHRFAASVLLVGSLGWSFVGLVGAGWLLGLIAGVIW